ncbi:MAG: hypothetical protein IJZ63_04125, partial [Clostridia bacterium]|nr:hypothetical protein [Clostridia bacterium]
NEFMNKEKLTLKDIKYDLNKNLKGHYALLALFSLLLFFAILLMVWAFIVISVPPLQLILQGAFLIILSLACVIMSGNYILKLHSSLGENGHITVDKLVGFYTTETHGKRHRTFYHLNFSSYGEYVINENNYCWSKLGPMSAFGVYSTAETGDEFYLVLSKRHSGKILLVYNKKFFELET